jgi:hypothetical protein
MTKTPFFNKLLDSITGDGEIDVSNLTATADPLQLLGEMDELRTEVDAIGSIWIESEQDSPNAVPEGDNKAHGDSEETDEADA